MPMLPKRPAALHHFDQLLADESGVPIPFEVLGTAANTVILKDKYAIENKTICLDGASYVQFKNSADFDISGSFTVSFWENINSISGIPAAFALSSTVVQTSMNAGLLFGYFNGGNRYIYASSSGSSWNQINAYNLGAPNYNVWVHWEIGYDATTKKLCLFKDGVLLNTFTLTANLYNDPSKSNYLGIPWNSGYINALIADFSFTDGVCNHTSDFTPNPPNSTAVNRGIHPMVSAGQSKFGDASLYTNGTNYLCTKLDSFILDTTQDFTVSFWEYQLTTSSSAASLAINALGLNGSSGIAGLLIGYNNNGNKYFYASSGTAGPNNWDISNAVVITTITSVLNRWVHWEVCYQASSKTLFVFLDGVLKYSVVCAIPVKMQSPNYTRSGNWAAGFSQSAYQDELMIIQGACLHTSNFTPPSDPYDYPTADPFQGIDFDEYYLGEKSAIRYSNKSSYDFSELEPLGDLTRKTKPVIRVEQLEGVGSLIRKVKPVVRVEQLEGVGSRVQGLRVLNEDLVMELDAGLRDSIKLAYDFPSLDSTDRESSIKNSFELEVFDFDTNLNNEFNLLVTPTHQHRDQAVHVQVTSTKVESVMGKYKVLVGNIVLIPYGENDVDVRNLEFSINPSDLVPGVNLCKVEYSGDSSGYVQFKVIKEALKRESVERTFLPYDGGYKTDNVMLTGKAQIVGSKYTQTYTVSNLGSGKRYTIKLGNYVEKVEVL